MSSEAIGTWREASTKAAWGTGPVRILDRSSAPMALLRNTTPWRWSRTTPWPISHPWITAGPAFGHLSTSWAVLGPSSPEGSPMDGTLHLRHELEFDSLGGLQNSRQKAALCNACEASRASPTVNSPAHAVPDKEALSLSMKSPEEGLEQWSQQLKSGLAHSPN